MPAPRPFHSELVFKEQISEATLRAYNVGFDQNKFRLDPVLDTLMSVILEFAFGYHEGVYVPVADALSKTREAARRIYTTSNYQHRGEFGEIILHFLLRDFCNTVPLISKIYFKDSANVTVKGFDGVHVQVEGENKKLWLGESKIYENGVDGVRDLARDVGNHITGDYLRREFSLISKKVPIDFQNRDHWLTLMHEHQTLDNIFNSICVPCVCTYSSELFQSYSDATDAYLTAFERECRLLKGKFDGANTVTNIDIILMLFPIPSKAELITRLDEKLKKAQDI